MYIGITLKFASRVISRSCRVKTCQNDYRPVLLLHHSEMSEEVDYESLPPNAGLAVSICDIISEFYLLWAQVHMLAGALVRFSYRVVG